MFFFLSKFFAFFTMPSNLLFLLALIGLVLMATRFARAGRRLLVDRASSLLLLFGFSPLGRQARPRSGEPLSGLGRLARRARRHHRARRRDRAGRVRRARRARAQRRRRTHDRGRDLARRYPAAKIVFTGGSAACSAASAKPIMCGRSGKALALRPSRIVLETRFPQHRRKRHHDQGAGQSEARRTLAAGDVGWHMPRSVGVFRQAGFPVEPYPVDWITTGDELWLGRSDISCRRISCHRQCRA